MKFSELTQKEQDVLTAHFNIAKDGCCASNAKSLLVDNYSCATMSSFKPLLKDLSRKQIGGVLSSLIKKECVYREDSEDSVSGNDIFWIEDSFLEENITLEW